MATKALNKKVTAKKTTAARRKPVTKVTTAKVVSRRKVLGLNNTSRKTA